MRSGFIIFIICLFLTGCFLSPKKSVQTKDVKSEKVVISKIIETKNSNGIARLPEKKSLSKNRKYKKETPFKKSCSNRWYVTGYFTPVEKDYNSGAKRTIRVEKAGYKKFSKKFLKAVKMEGWGKTNKGWYLGYYSRKWHKSKTPLDAYGKQLVVGVMAVDKKQISKGQRIKIPTLPNPLNNITFTAKDTGSAIKGKHIDLYMGEGKSAEKITFTVTGKKHTICKL